jgi:hypothetical protein
MRLQLGPASQSIEVTGVAPTLATQDAVTGQEVDRTLINNLPLVDRNVMDLAFLSPGVIQVPGHSYGTGTGINFVSNGGRNDTTEVLLDGIAQTSYEPNTAIYTPLYQPSVDAVQEFKIMQNNYTAEEGFSGNTYINMVMRSGTNAYHGDVYEFLRNKALDANDFFSNAAGGKLPSLHRNQFGGSVGGPIKKDKAFFFFNYEGLRVVIPVAQQVSVPTAGSWNNWLTATISGNSAPMLNRGTPPSIITGSARTAAFNFGIRIPGSMFRAPGGSCKSRFPTTTLQPSRARATPI